MSAPLVWITYNWALAVDEGFELGYLAGLGSHSLTANPIEYTNRFLGAWALRFLLVGLAVTPLAQVLKKNELVAYRRMIGLWAFTYVCFHLISYIALDQFFAWNEIWQDMVKRNYITLGMLGFVLLVPLAITSTRGWIRRLGAKRWRSLHKAAYLIAPLGAAHYFMMAKGNQPGPKIYIAVVLLLLGSRVWFFLQSGERRRMFENRMR
jgi:sulfoxide reductase heme-binding subunit YedZ